MQYLASPVIVGGVTSPSGQDDRIALHTEWVPATAPPHKANSFLIGIEPLPDGSPGDLIVTAGWALIPRISGSQEEQRAHLVAMGNITVAPVAEFCVNLERAEELYRALGETISKVKAYRSSQGGGGVANTG